MTRLVPRLDADAEGERRTAIFDMFLTDFKVDTGEDKQRTNKMKRGEEQCRAGAVQSPLCLCAQERCDIRAHRRQPGRLVHCSGPEGLIEKHELEHFSFYLIQFQALEMKEPLS